MELVSETVGAVGGKGGWDDGGLQSLAVWAHGSRNRKALRFLVWSWLLMKARIQPFIICWVPAMLGQVLGTGKTDQGLDLDLEEEDGNMGEDQPGLVSSLDSAPGRRLAVYQTGMMDEVGLMGMQRRRWFREPLWLGDRAWGRAGAEVLSLSD